LAGQSSAAAAAAGKGSQPCLFDLLRRDQEFEAFDYLHGTDATFGLTPARRRPLIAGPPGGLDDGLTRSYVEVCPAWLDIDMTDLAHAWRRRADLCHDLASAGVLYRSM
jgi:hypothetical protein